MTREQQGDVYLFQTVDDGDISVNDGIVTMNGGLETAAYVSLFGGNEDDDGRDNNPNNWWANLNETQDALQYRSETQYLLNILPATSGNLKRIEDAAGRDLQWFLDSNVASSVTVEATIPAVNTIKLTIAINAVGQESNFEFVENWKVAA